MGPEHLAMLIPIISIILGLSLAMLMVYLKYRRDTEALKLSHAERLAALEKGIELPPPPSPLSQIQELRESRRARISGQRTSGLVLLFAGLAITLAIWQSAGEDYWWGMVPGSIGLALLLASIIDARDDRNASPPPPGPRPPEM